jgi:hypothetical protein
LKAFRKSGVAAKESGLTGPIVMKLYCRNVERTLGIRESVSLGVNDHPGIVFHTGLPTGESLHVSS